MKRILLTLTLTAASFAQAAVVNPLPNNIQNGQPADATKVMANFNQIVTNVNANAAAINATNIFTAPQQFSAGLTLNQGTIVSQVLNDNLVWLGVAGGTANALTATSVITPAAYQAGQRWKVTAALANTGPVTININGLGVRTISKFGGAALIAGDIVAGQVLVLEDDGVRLQMINTTIPSGIPYADAGGTPNAITVTYLLPSKNMTLVDGLDLTVGIPASNTGTAVTLTPTINGVTFPTWNVKKFVNNIEAPVAVGDIQGDAWFKADVPNSVWVLMNPVTPSFPAAGSGLLVANAGVVASTGATALVKFSTLSPGTFSFTPQTATKTMIVLCIGGGGNGGNGNSAAGGGGGGGGAGSVAMATITPVTGTYSVSVGTAGGTSSFGGVVSAVGGGNGAASVNVNGGAGGTSGANGLGGGGAGPSGTAGANALSGNGGNGGNGNGSNSVGGGGGGATPSILIPGGGATNGGVGAGGGGGGGTALTFFGAGGGGGGGSGSAGGAGGAGSAGIILVWEYQ